MTAPDPPPKSGPSSRAGRLLAAAGMVAVLGAAIGYHRGESGGASSVQTGAPRPASVGSASVAPPRSSRPAPGPTMPTSPSPGPWLAGGPSMPVRTGSSAWPDAPAELTPTAPVSPTSVSSGGVPPTYPGAGLVASSAGSPSAAPAGPGAADAPVAGGWQDDIPATRAPPGPFAPASYSQAAPPTRQRVDARDSFWLISERAYGTGAYFRALYAHNQANFPRPDHPPEGAVVDVPPVKTLQQLYPDLCPGVEEIAATATEGTRRRYTTRAGETLGRIAEEQLGDRLRWTEIYRLNSRLIADHRVVISPGTELTLPQDRSFAREAAVRADLIR